MDRRIRKWLAAGILAGAVLGGCGLAGTGTGKEALSGEGVLSGEMAEDGQSAANEDTLNEDSFTGPSDVEKEAYPDLGQIPLRDNKLLYANDNEDSVVTMYLTVRRGSAGEGTNHSWEEINRYSVYDYEDMGVDRYQVEGLLQVGDENGPLPGELGYGDRTPNATVQIRGQTSSRNAQKNYKIRLKDNKGTWRGQQTIALNKHQTDGLRFRNKLGFDLLKGLDETFSLRTQFVHLYVKDETEGENGGFVDYGLYTQVEQLNKAALRAHGLDRNGHLYKINSFEFFRYEDVIRMASDPEYDQKAFEALLEIKGNEDHGKLIAMLEDVNNYSLSIDEVLDKHFNRENLVYWIAFQILTGNIDTQNRNCYIYSPQNLDTWYFLSWDMDGMMSWDENAVLGWSDYGAWERGVSNYWGNVLFQRCLKSAAFRDELDEAVTVLKEKLTDGRIQALMEEYQGVTQEYLYRMPDVVYAPLTPEAYADTAQKLPELVEFYYQN